MRSTTARGSGSLRCSAFAAGSLFSSVLLASLLCGAVGAAGSLGCQGKDSTQVTAEHQGGTGGAAPSAESGGSGAGGVAGSPAAAGGSGGPGTAGGDGGGQQCTGTPWTSFVEAQAICAEDCAVCAIDIVANRPVHYFTAIGDHCACPSPAPRYGPDAGLSGPPASCSPRGGFLTEEQALSNCAEGAGDAGACRVCREDSRDAGAPRSWSVTRAGCECPATQDYECGSFPNLSEAEATALCSGLSDCRVCVQQTDPAGLPEIWMAHACGCPEPYRRPE